MNRRILLPAACAGVMALALPAAAQQTPAPTEQPPAAGPLRPFTVPAVREFRLANGVRVVLVEKHSLPIVAGRVLVSAGSVYEPADKNGLALLTALLVDEGTGSLTGPQIAERMETLGAQFSTSANYAQATLSVTAPSGTFGDAMALAAASITDPAFSEVELTRVRGQMTAAHAQGQSTVEGLALRAFSRAVYDPASAYSRPVGGTATTLRGLTRDDVVGFHRRMYVPANTTVLLVGDVTPAEARRVAEQALGRWTVAGATRAVAPRPAPVASTGTRVILVDRPGSVQSGVYVGQPGVAADHPDVLAFTALSQVLGGGFRARMHSNLREAHGWTYGASSGLTTHPDAGSFFVTSSIRTNATDSAIAEIAREYRRIATEAVPANELSGSVANLVGSFPNSVQTVQGLAGRLQTLLQNGQPLNYYNSYLERLAAVVPADVSRVGRERLTPGALTIVVAGDLSRIEAPIRALSLGTVEVVDASGNKIR